MISAALESFARLLGIKDDQAEDALVSERAARLVLSRRSLLGVAGTLTTGALFSFGKDQTPKLIVNSGDYAGHVQVGDNVIVQAKRGSTLASFDAFLKERYTDVLSEVVWKNDAYALAMGMKEMSGGRP